MPKPRRQVARLSFALILLWGKGLADSGLSVEWPTLDNPAYREALFHLYADDPFTGATRLRASLDNEIDAADKIYARLLLGGIYLAYGLDNDAEALFKQTLKRTELRSDIGDYLWFYMAKLRFQRGQLAESRQALDNIRGILPWQLQEERQLLEGMIALREGGPSRAIDTLERFSSRSIFAAYGRYNLAVSYLEADARDRAIGQFEQLTKLSATTAEHRALVDMAHLALGHLYLNSGDTVRALAHYQQVDSAGPLHLRGLQGQGVAYSSAGEYRKALAAWNRLLGASVVDDGAMLSVLAIPYNQSKLETASDAERHYLNAVATYEREIQRLGEAIDFVRSPDFLRGAHANSGESGRRTDMNLLQDPAIVEYLTPLLARAEFQNTVRDFIEISAYSARLVQWNSDLRALTDLIATTRNSLIARLPAARGALSRADIDRLRDSHRRLSAGLSKLQDNENLMAMASTQQRLQWGRMLAAEATLGRLDPQLDTAPLRARIELLEKVLRWDILSDHRARLAELTTELTEIERNIGDLEHQTRSVRATLSLLEHDPQRLFDQYEARISEYHDRIAALGPRVVTLANRLEARVVEEAVVALELHLVRLESYLAQTYLALAQLYDTDPSKADIDPYNRHKELAARHRAAIDYYTTFIQLTNDAALRLHAQHRVADLTMSIADEQFRNGSHVNAAEVREYYLLAAKRYDELLAQSLPSTDRAKALYQLARARERSADLAGAADALEQFAVVAPSDPHILETQFRRAELYSALGDYSAALEAYTALVGTTADPALRTAALYKQGWTLLQLGRYQESLQSLFTLLEATDAHNPGAGLTDAMATDTWRAASLCFSYMDGADSIARFFRGWGRRSYEPQVYEHLAALYSAQGRVRDTAQTYRVFARELPSHPRALELRLQVLASYEAGGLASLAMETKQELVEDYLAVANGTLDTPALRTLTPKIPGFMLDIARAYSALEEAGAREDGFAQAAVWYEKFLREYPQNPARLEAQLGLAAALSADGRVQEASKAYEAAAYGTDGDRQRRADAAYHALALYEVLNKGAPDTAASPSRDRELAALLRFADTFSNDTRTPVVLVKRAELLFALDRTDEFYVTAKRALAQTQDADLQRRAWTILGHQHYNSGEYEQAEAAYTRAIALADGDDGLRAALEEQLAAAVFQQARLSEAQADDTKAIELYLRVATLTPGSQIARTAEYRAALALYERKDWARAIPLLEAVRLVAQTSEAKLGLSERLAQAHVAAGQPREAADEFMRISALRGDYDGRRLALLQAATLLDKSGAKNEAIDAYERYIRDFPQPFPSRLEAEAWLAATYHSIERQDLAELWTRRVEQSARAEFPRLDARGRHLGAEAALELAGRQHARYSAVKLKQPLEKTLSAKQQGLERTLDAYRRVYDYADTEASSAATFHLGQAYAELAQAVLESELPPALSAQEREQYALLLEEQAIPFEDKAIELHKSNVAGIGNGLYNEWVQLSLRQLGELFPARYARSEKREDFVDELR